MKSIFASLILVIVFLAVSTFPSKAQTPEQLYQKGLLKEEGEGALQDAINLFNQVADNSKADQSVRAKALLHIGMCYEKMGNQGAVKAYQQIVSNFPSQKNEVAVARERLLRLTRKDKPGEVSVKQVWEGPGVNGYGNVTADGTCITYLDWETGNVAMHVLKTNENKQVTTEATWLDSIQYAEYSLISPDARQVAYVWYYKFINYQLRLIKTGSQKPEILYSCLKNEYIKPEAWFSNGEKIIVQRYTPSTRMWNLLLINTSTKEIQVIKELGPRSNITVNLALSPDEKYIAFDLPNPADNGMRDIYLLTVSTGEEYKLIEHPSNDLLVGWLRGRNELLFTSDRHGTTDLWAVKTESGKLTEAPKRILTNSGEIDPMGFTDDGTLFYSLLTTNFESFIVPFGNEKGYVNMNLKTPLAGQLYDISWLPDGESLLGVLSIVGNDKQRRNKLYFINLKTKESRILAENLVIVGQCRLSPDGKSVLAFCRDKDRLSDLNYKGGIYSIDIKTGSPVEIKVKQDASQSFSLEWSNNGRGIYYVSNFQLFNHNIENGEEKTIYSDKRFYNPSIIRSSDGRNLIANVVTNMNDNSFQLLSIPQSVGEVKVLCSYRVTGNIRFNRIALSPNGKYIYLSALAPGVKSILCRIPATGGTPENLWQSPYYFIAGISINPAGNKIALSTFETAEEIRVIENLGMEVSKIYERKE